MGLTKSEIFSDKQNKLASMMKALAHPARIAIVQYLLKANACVNGQLAGVGNAEASTSRPTPVAGLPRSSTTSSIVRPCSRASPTAILGRSLGKRVEAAGTTAKSDKIFYLTSAAQNYGLTLGSRSSPQIELTDLGRSIVYAASPEEELEKKIL